MNKLPLISVIMNCHNGKRFLSSSIESVLNQSYKNWEIIFFDNNSSDNSKEIFKSYKDKRLKYFKSSKLINLYAARNLALKKTKGKFITFLDTDDLWNKEKLKKQIKKILKDKNLFLYSNYYILHKNKKKLLSKKVLPSGYITTNLLKYYFIGILTVMFDKDLIKKNKLSFNKKYNIIGDFDLFIKLSTKTKFSYLHDPVATYRKHSQNYSRTNVDLYIKELKYWYQKNKKNYGKHDLKNLFFLIKYLEAKYDIFNFKYIDAIKKIIKFPISVKKIKLFLLLFLRKKNFSF
jgi:glycosyltransferase involved in cell wall biosynthesis|tara:strand:+ start:14 stop:886 length:873 start_codon:yes stop_codon:yes gene_type:complete